MQIMACKSEEGILDGLGWIDGEVKKFDASSNLTRMQLPHMGWNDVHALSDGGLFQGIHADSRFYFLHSYFFLPQNQTHIYSFTDYNGAFASSVRRENIYGVQFHPEKSHQWGIQLLKNFDRI